MAGAGERAALGENVYVSVDGDDLRLGETLVLFEVTLISGLYVTPVLGGQVLVENVGIVEIPCSTADCGYEEKRRRRDETRGALRGETETVDKMSARVKFDIDYLNQWSLWMDIKILVRTVLLVLRDERAY